MLFPKPSVCLNWLAANLEKRDWTAWNIIIENSDNQSASVPGKRV